MSSCIGYIVLTGQPDGSWSDDWDGEVHPDRAAGDLALMAAWDALGADGARLVACYPVEASGSERLAPADLGTRFAPDRSPHVPE